MVCTAFI